MSKKKALLIAEKPSLMRDIMAAYNTCKNDVQYDIDFVAQAGHLVELLSPVEMNPIYKSWDVSYLPINPKKEGGWKYKVSHNTKDLYKDILKRLNSGDYDYVIHAGDTDKEGELLVRLVLQQANNKLPVLRLWYNDTTREKLCEALLNLESDNLPRYENLYKSALFRQHSDWLVGMNGSRAIADKINTQEKIAAGRVMTWVQTTIVNREDEINNFIPKTSYSTKASFDAGYDGELCEKNEEGNYSSQFFETEAEAQKITDYVKDKEAKILKVDEKKITTYAPKLYKLATLQQDASSLGYSANQTLEIVQRLYEKHLLSYPRTDCEYISSKDNFRQIISSAACVPGTEDVANKAIKEINNVINNSKYVNDKELAKHGHSALVPTTETPDFNSLSKQEQDIYTLIAKRFLAIFLPPMITNKTNILTQVDDYLFNTNGKVVLDAGFSTFLGMESKDIELPDVHTGDRVKVINAENITRTTTCPKRFTDGSIIQAMENPSKYLSDKSIKDNLSSLCIGTPATRGDILEKLVSDKYIERDKKNVLKPTEFGSFMIHTINGISICQLDTTGHWEEIIRKIQLGEISYEEAENFMDEQIDDLLNSIQKVNKVNFGKTRTKEALMICPSCGKEILEGEKNYFCTGYKDGCGYSLWKVFMGAKITAEDAKNLFEGKTIEKEVEKKDKSKKWKQKICFNPELKKIDFVEAEAEDTNIDCPKCKQTIKKKGSKFECECGFSIWSTMLGTTIPDDEIKEILTNGKSSNKLKFVSKKTGKPFEAYLILDTDENALKFQF